MEFYSFLLYFSPFILICITVLSHIPNRLSHKRKLPPGPTGLPIIGSLLTIGDRPHESLTNLAKTHGALMTVQMGSVTTVVASSTEMAKEILQKHDQAFLGRPVPDAVTAQADYELSMAWLPGGPQWRKLRKLCNSQIFTTQRLDVLQDLRHQMMNKMVGELIQASEAGEAIHIGRLVFGTSLNLLANTMFSVDMLDPESNEIDELKELIWRIMELAGKPNVADYFPFLKAFDPQGIRRDVKVSYDRLHGLLDDIMDRRMKRRAAGAPRCNDFLDVLLDHSQDHGPQELSLPEIRLLLADLFIGGTDTTTTTMEWSMAELLRNGSIMAKAKHELAESIGSERTIQEKDLPRLPYLEAVIKETMRLHPTAPLLLPHRAEADVQVCGYTIPRHTQVLVNYWSIARDTAYWDEPIQFAPERFVGSDMDFRGRNFSFTPFGAGRRICPGLGLGVRMVNLLLASLLHHFDWKLPGGIVPEEMDMKDKFGVTLQKADPLVAIPIIVA